MELIWTLTILASIILQASNIPQLVRTYKRKTSKDISVMLWVLVFVGYILLLSVAILSKNNLFIFVYVFGGLGVGSVLIQTLYYRTRNL